MAVYKVMSFALAQGALFAAFVFLRSYHSCVISASSKYFAAFVPVLIFWFVCSLVGLFQWWSLIFLPLLSVVSFKSVGLFVQHIDANELIKKQTTYGSYQSVLCGLSIMLYMLSWVGLY